MVSRPPRIIYLHGFASSPRSRKAQFFSDRLRSLGHGLKVPDLEQGDFEGLTISRQLALVGEIASGEPAILIGSSMGGYVAALYAARHPEVDRLVLLAPAFGLHQLWMAELTPEHLEQWKSEGAFTFFHYGAARQLALGYQFLDDAAQFEPFPKVSQPILVFHGNHDASVPIEQSLAFLRVNPHARLIRLESGHELTDVLPSIWEHTEYFISAIRTQLV
jgi:pimeloyl-ACP methyl ester carboxylesterase